MIVDVISAGLDQWNEFFFADEPMASLALFRVAFGLVLLVNGVLLLRDVETWFGATGVLPMARYREGPGKHRLSVFMLLPDSSKSAYVVIGVHLLSAVALTAGLWTQASALVAFATISSLHQRNPMICHGGDCVLRLMCLLLIFSDTGSVLSVDLGGINRGESSDTASAWPLRLMQIQVAIIYLRAGLGKFRGSTWRNGTAPYYATGLREHQRLRLSRRTRASLPLRVLTWATLVVEVAVPLGVWWDTLRYPVLGLAVALHLGIEVLMNVQLFSWTMLVCLILFVAPADAQVLLETIP